MNATLKERWRERGAQLAYFVLTGLILVVPALMNGSPLVYADSGTYMRFAFDIEVPMDRPVGYSLIIRACTWRATMWTVIYFQGAVTSWLLFEVLRQLFPRSRSIWRLHMLVITTLVLLSSLPWYAAQVMPDVFAGLLALLVFLLCFGRMMGTVKTAFLFVLLFFFTISHYSFMAMMLGVVALLPLLRISRWGRRAMGPRPWRNWTGLAVTTAASILFVMASNYQQGRGMVLSAASDLFLAAKLCESGVMYEHLNRTCPERPQPMCERMNELNATAMHFVWDMGAPIRYDYTGLDDASRNIAPLVHEVLVDPRNWGGLVWSSITATLVQLAQVSVGSGIEPYRENSTSGQVYQDKLRHELPMYMNSVEQRGAWRLETVNMLAGPVLLIALLVIVLCWPSGNIRWQLFVIMLLLMVVLNAAATGALANVYDRLQARVTWLLPLAAILLAVRQSNVRWVSWTRA